MNFNICVIQPRGFLHTRGSEELRASLEWGLASLGHGVQQNVNAFSASRSRNIIFHAELLGPESGLPPDSIIYNLESKGHPRLELVVKLAQKNQATVWEYSERNLEMWKQAGVPAVHVPVGFTPNLLRVPPNLLTDWDVMFVGWFTPRRLKIINDLREAGLKVFASDSCYGGARDYVMSRSKICLNVHHDGRDAFEIVRVSYYLANSKCVVSENSVDGADYAWIGNGMSGCEYGDLVGRVRALLEPNIDSGTLRQVYENEGLARIQEQDYANTLRRVVGQHVIAVTDTHNNKDTESSTVRIDPPNPPTYFLPRRFVEAVSLSTHLERITQRYEKGLQAGDMKDFMLLLRSLASGKMLEIGVRDGASTSALLLGLEDRQDGGFLTSCDIVDCSGLWEHPKWEFVKTSSHDLDIDPATLDLAFIDGDHSIEAYSVDLENCLRWTRPGGVILCHDIAPDARWTNEAAGGQWPSKFVGEVFWRTVRERKLRAFAYPGDWGMGVVIV